jgi:CHAT domain-containing protein
MDEYDAALDHYRQAIQLIEGLRAGISSEAARAGFFATIVDTYANTVLLCLASDRQAEAYDYVERARARALLDVLAAGGSETELSQTMEATPMTLAEVQAALPADGLLIEYFTTGLEEARLGQKAGQAGVQRHRFPQARTLIFAITHDEIQVCDSGLDPNTLRPSQLDSAVERHFLEPEIRRRLYERLIAPVESLLQGKDQVYLIPHGPLHYIPFQALVSADGDTLLREAGPQLVYAPSATLLIGQRPRVAGRAAVPCLALGYNGEDEQALRYAEDEATNIARLTGGHALVGPAPKKAALYREAGDYRLLHFSCHGDFDPEAPLASALRLAPGEVLTALDVIQHLHVSCDLVTLSACESGLSRVRRGDELVGFLRAFVVAGTPALVSSLWRADERSTRILMEKFYQAIQGGVGFAEALKKAQLYLRELTRQEALEVLAQLRSEENRHRMAVPGERQFDRPKEQTARQQARFYLKGLANEGGEGEVGSIPGKEMEEKIFADPYYWAPFILVGDHGTVSSGRE